VLFILTISVPRNDAGGWEGTIHLPTLQLEASTWKDAEQRVADIIQHLPTGSVGDLVPA